MRRLMLGLVIVLVIVGCGRSAYAQLANAAPTKALQQVQTIWLASSSMSTWPSSRSQCFWRASSEAEPRLMSDRRGMRRRRSRVRR